MGDLYLHEHESPKNQTTSVTSSTEVSSLLDLHYIDENEASQTTESSKPKNKEDNDVTADKTDVERQASVISRGAKAYGFVVNKVVEAHTSTNSCYNKYSKIVKYVLKVCLLVGYIVYLGFAFKHSFGDEGSITLLCLTCIILFGWAYYKVKIRFGRRIKVFFRKYLKSFYERDKKIMKRLLYVSVLLLVTVYIIVDVVIQRPAHLIPCLGFILYTALVFFFSASPGTVKWRPIIWGIVLQLVLAIIALRTRWGYAVINWLSQRILDFMAFADEGSKFVFGDSFKDHFFVFSVMPTIVFFSSAIAVLYHLGYMQIVIDQTAFVMEYTLGVSAMESIHAAFNLFIGWGEALLVIRPVLDKMTCSELHTIMTSSFATISGSNLPIYIMYGIPANHMLSASFISAPAALAMAKLSYPDDRNEDDDTSLELPEVERFEGGIIDAATTGAVSVICIITHVVACVVAYVGLLALTNAILAWFGDRVGLEMLTLQIICSYIFWPFVYMMGVPVEDCKIVARMLGVKLCVNELIAYHDLGVVMKNRESLEAYNGTWHWTKADDIVLETTNTTLTGGVISHRSEIITTYALCGFSDMVSYGIMVAALTAMSAGRKTDVLKVGYRALTSGVIACFLSACMAGFIGDF